jgi:hypothetical protein
MIASTEFRRHAAECKRMARTTADRDSRAAWKSLADRWITAAELAERAEASLKSLHAVHRPLRRRSRFDGRSLAH